MSDICSMTWDYRLLDTDTLWISFGKTEPAVKLDRVCYNSNFDDRDFYEMTYESKRIQNIGYNH